MSKKLTDTFQPKITRNDRFAQMSQQEKIIEQKKREILAKLEAKQKASAESGKSTNTNVKVNKSPIKKEEPKKQVNLFSNDGSFLDQFKQLKDKRLDSKLKSFKSKDNHGDDHGKSRWLQKRRSQSPKERPKSRISRFDKSPNFEPKITINTSFRTCMNQPVYDIQQQLSISPQNVTGQPLLKNLLGPPTVAYPTTQSNDAVIAAPPVLINVPPPQMVMASPQMTLQQNTVLTAVTLPPPSMLSAQPLPVTAPVLPAVELSSIPPPNPIQVQNIPQPEPMNALNIPQPAPMQVQNIPTPSAIQLNEIPNPKPLDVLSIPTPGDEKSISDPDFIKNIPPPNKAIPPPGQANLLPPSMLPVAVHNHLPPPQLQNTFAVANSIPSLMAQPVLPPPGMNVNCPPPLLPIHATGGVLQPPPSVFVSQMPPMNVPPPNANLQMVNSSRMMSGFKDINAGTADYEAMASLGRMVAQCGTGIEDVVRQRKTQDPSLWFLFHKESAAYRQYQQLVEQFRRETINVDPEDMYDPENSTDDVMSVHETKIEQDLAEFSGESYGNKRKRKSRWGDKDPNITPPAVIAILPQPVNTKGPVMLSKVTKHDPALIQYAVNTFGSANLTEEEWKKAEDHYKINLLYQDMVKKREELERLRSQGKNKYDYDSDEEVDGGTWEHKLREKEMMATQLWAQELNRQAEGKHHIGDFLPPDELKRFLEKSNATKEGRLPNFSDYKEFKIKEDNIGFKMLQKLGWTEGMGLGQNGSGIVDPVNKAASRDQNQGLGLNQMDEEDDDDEYESYRKRMMLAYRFRPNPLNNPRRPYY